MHTARAIRVNIGFTAGYNAIGLILAALGILPMMLAAAAQSLPDLGILANSAGLLRHCESIPPSPPPGHHPIGQVVASGTVGCAIVQRPPRDEATRRPRATPGTRARDRAA